MIAFLRTKVYQQFTFLKKDDGVAQTNANYKFINSVLKLCGMHVYSQNFSVFNPILLITIFDVTTYIMVNIYTVVLYWGDLLKVSFCLATLGCGFQGCVKLYTCMAKTRDIKKLQRDTLEIVEHPDNDRVKYSQLMYMRWCHISLRILSLLGLGAGLFILLQPSLQAIITGQRILPYGFILPFVDTYGNPGYFLNWVHHFLQTYFAISALLGTLLININLLFHVYMQIDTMVLMLERLNEMCSEVAVVRNVKKQQEMGVYLEKIIRLHQKNSKFVKEFNEIFSFHALINILSLVFQITVTMVAVVSFTSWLIGYVILLMALLQLFFECFIGTILYKYNDLLRIKIYDISWDDMSVTDQKSLAMFLRLAQHPNVLSYKFGYVDLSLYVEVLKRVYSIFMALQNFQ